MNLVDQEDCNQGNACQRDDKKNESFSEGGLRFRQLLVPVVVFVLICLVDLVEQAVVGHCLVANVYDVSDKRDDGYSAGDLDDVGLNEASRNFVVSIVHEIFGEDGG